MAVRLGRPGRRSATLLAALAIMALLVTAGAPPALGSASGASAAPTDNVARAVAGQQAGETEAGALQATVGIEDRVFLPTEITVPVGTLVTWTNRGRVPHTTTSPGVWDSGPIALGGSWSLRFDAPGAFDYVCTIHPSEMRARVTVEAPAPSLVDPDGSRGTNPAFAGVGSLNPAFPSVGAVAGAGVGAARLVAQGDSGVSGEATMLQAGPSTVVTVTLSGLAPGTAHAGHIHGGACDGPILFPLETITADGAGQGRATATIDAPLDPSAWWVQYHASASPPGPPVACGPVQAQ